jgi:hypothetical protein
MADQAARKALLHDEKSAKYSRDDAHSSIKNYYREKTEMQWQEQHNKLREIKNSPWRQPQPSNINSFDMRKIPRLRISHTKLTHEHLFHGLYYHKCPYCETD